MCLCVCVCVQWEGECETLQGMVRERNQFITSMKSEIYRKEYRNDTERVDLQTQIIQKDKMIAALEVHENVCGGEWVSASISSVL